MMVALPAGFARAEGEKITDIQVKGNRRIEAAAILNAVRLKAGDLLYADKVDADIRAIYKLGQFQNITAETVPADKGVILVYRVVEKGIVRDVKIEGTKELTTEKVREVLEVKPNTVYSPRDVAKSVKKVKKLYADEGYYLAEVETQTDKRGETDVRVVFKITEGKKVLIKKIEFEGNRAFTPRQLRKAMETGEKWMLSWLTGAGTYKEEVLKNDVNLIADLYFNIGYVNVKVGEPKVELLPDKSALVVTIGITEGEQFRTGTIGFKGDLLEKEGELAAIMKLKTGDVFSRGLLRNDVFALTDVYADKGYAFANVTPQTRVNPEKKTIDLVFDMEKGEKVYIDRINISGNTKSRDKVVRRELRVTEGELYSSTGIKRSKTNLMNLGYFEEANISTAKGSADNKLNVNVEVKEKATGTFSVGAGYSSLDGLIGQGSVQQANFLGLGLKANLSASLGGKSQTYNVGVTDPYFLDSKWTFGGDVYRSERDYIDFSRRVTGFDLKGGYPLSDNVSTFLLYKYEDKKVYNESAALKESIALGMTTAPETTSTTSSVTASITRNTTDYRLDPSRGMVNTLSAEFAGLGGTNRYARYVTENSLFIPAMWGTVLSLRGTVGHIQSVGGKRISIDELFYLGGINTIRGYNGRTVSPHVSNNVVNTDINGISSITPITTYVGGNTESYFNIDYSFPLLKDAGLKGVLFFDAGNAYDGLDKLFSRFQTSYGLGVRWFSPLGPLRLEYGIPFNPRTGIDKASGRLEFSIGSFF
nr:outer membrane protein assembly factor BamA [Geobacter sp. AOG1]